MGVNVEFLEICAELAKGEHPFKTVVIDTIDILYRLCADHICQKRGLEHESDGSHGKIYGLIKNEIYRVLTKLAHLPYGLILISHSQDRDLETRTGTVTRTVPTLSESFRQIVIGLVDLILYCDVQIEQAEDGTRWQGHTQLDQFKVADDSPGFSAISGRGPANRCYRRRVVRTKPSPNYDAGDRFGCLPEVMDLNYQAFAKAFGTPKTPPTPASAGAAKSTK